QISGVEGYVESAASGLYAALNMVQYMEGSIELTLGPDTMMGAMAAYISDPHIKTLQPMNANFGIFKCPYNGDKAHKKAYFVSHALDKVREYAEHVSVSR
ncbi:MAG: FAD-dependent oxidoreductase, partial [Erysipelotrichaceae bacterium]|nr:FAD-dependent oxidoreductase [Erysipelotrichaceae bacterium]